MREPAGLRQRQSSVARPGERICVAGPSGSGKTYVAHAAAARLGLRYICNDAAIWRPGWQPAPRDEVYADFERQTRDPGWTFDGNLGDSPEDSLVLGRCDTLVWLDLPRWLVWWQVTARTLARAWSREPLWHGNMESWRTMLSRDSIIWWSIKTYTRLRRRNAERFRDPGLAGLTHIRLRSRGEVNAWLASLTPISPDHGNAFDT